MELVYLDHTMKQMAEPSISDSEVRAVLSNPNAISPGFVRGRLAYDGSAGGRRLRVVIEGGTDAIIVHRRDGHAEEVGHVNVDAGYDPDRQLLYVRLKWPHGSVVETEDFGGDRYVDYDDGGDVVGIEFLAIGEDGVNLEGLPDADRVGEAIGSIQRLVVAR